MPPVDRFEFVFRITRLLKKLRIPSHKRTFVEIHDCPGQREPVQDRAKSLQVFS